MRRLLVLAFFVACKSQDAASTGASASASASASAQPATTSSVLVTRGAWWRVAQKSRVYTEERRVDADNALRVLPEAQRDVAVRALNDMAKENADADGLRAAAQIARDAQDRVEDVHNPAARNAIATAGFIVLHGLVARACDEHPDAASLKPIMTAIREMPLPRLEKSDGRPERNVLEQELRSAVDDKTMKALLAGAPAPKKNL